MRMTKAIGGSRWGLTELENNARPGTDQTSDKRLRKVSGLSVTTFVRLRRSQFIYGSGPVSNTAEHDAAKLTRSHRALLQIDSMIRIHRYHWDVRKDLLMTAPSRMLNLPPSFSVILLGYYRARLASYVFPTNHTTSITRFYWPFVRNLSFPRNRNMCSRPIFKWHRTSHHGPLRLSAGYLGIRTGWWATGIPRTITAQVLLGSSCSPLDASGISSTVEEQAVTWRLTRQRPLVRNTVHTIRAHLQPPATQPPPLRTLTWLYYNQHVASDSQKQLWAWPPVLILVWRETGKHIYI